MNSQYVLNLIDECYLKGKEIYSSIEYDSGRYAISMYCEDKVYLLDRHLKHLTHRISNASGNKCIMNLLLIP